MRSCSPVPLVRQTDALPMLDVLRAAGAPTGELLRQAELPESLQEGEDGFIPFCSMLRFIGHAAHRQDMPDLCWRGVLEARPDHLGGWGRAVARCANLRDAILTFCNRFSGDAPLMDLGLEIGDETAWFWRRRPARVIGWLGDEEGQQFAVAAMIRIVRAAAGPEWAPHHIQIESDRENLVRAIAELDGCRVDLDRPVVAIALPPDLLDRRSVWNDGGETEASLLAAGETLAGSLQQAFVSLLPATPPAMEVAAEIAGVSVRTLRRRLAAEGTSWREVLDRARLEACRRLLGDPERSLAGIAQELYYSDPAHLTRAFRRWTGECPSAYRRRRLRR